MGATQQFSLKWNNYVQHITCAFDSLRCDEDLVDVTLSCEGRRIYAHKMLLSACSNYFKDVFKENPCKHPVIIFRNVKYEDLLAIIDFMYHGEVNVEQEHLSSFLTTAEMLAVQGLTVSTKDEPPVRKRPSMLESNQQSPVQDLSFNRQNNHKVSKPLGTQNPPVPSLMPTASPRPTTPVARKRRLSPQGMSVEKDIVVKRRVSDSATLVPKVEADDFDEESNLSEPDANLEDSQLDLSQDQLIDSPYSKAEASPTSEFVTEKASGAEQLKPGPSAGIESHGLQGDVDEEYLDTESEKTEEGSDTEGESVAYVVMTEDGEYEFFNATGVLPDSSGKSRRGSAKNDSVKERDVAIFVANNESPTVKKHSGKEWKTAVYVENDQLTAEKSSDKREVTFFVQDDDNDEEDPGQVEYIYAEGINEKNEIIIGDIPQYQCEFCDRVFKRLDSLRKHLSLHEGRTTCPVCSAVFSRVAHRNRHMRIKHPDLEIVTKRGRRRKQ